jgi:predicted enzyme related to lactoylglutathione lyase
MSAEESAVAWGGSGSYATLSAGGRRIAGAAPPMEGAPASWNVYFNVVDLDDSVAVAEAMGAKLITPPYDVDGTGRMAALTDPQGAMFSLLAN